MASIPRLTHHRGRSVLDTTMKLLKEEYQLGTRDIRSTMACLIHNPDMHEVTNYNPNAMAAIIYFHSVKAQFSTPGAESQGFTKQMLDRFINANRARLQRQLLGHRAIRLSTDRIAFVLFRYYRLYLSDST